MLDEMGQNLRQVTRAQSRRIPWLSTKRLYRLLHLHRLPPQGLGVHLLPQQVGVVLAITARGEGQSLAGKSAWSTTL